ncbi:MAG: hypothetical protein HY975_02260 [Candidatus Kerfeldbacteria bacterium]|nr:hypothetical protein [Candidatus Kerfeldbacteria bacterium]
MADAQEPRGDVLLEWQFPEFSQPERGRWWYLTFVILLAALIAYGLWTTNYTFVGFLVLLTLVLVIRLRRTPPNVRFAIRDEGIEVGNSYYAWREFREFWIIYRPPEVKKVYFNFKSSVRPALDISLESQNPLRIRQLLSERLLENAEREEEPSGDQLLRTLKL